MSRSIIPEEEKEEVGSVMTRPMGHSVRQPDRRDRDIDPKAPSYNAAWGEAATLAAGRTKCRELIDLCPQKSTVDAAAFSQAMMVVGAAASRHLGDPEKTAFTLGHMSRRFREGDQVDF